MQQVLDRHIRDVLHGFLRNGIASDPTARVLNELPVSTSREDGRVDVVVVNSHMHGFEIKSDADSLERLADRQVRIYSKVLDYLSVVVTPKHRVGVRKIIPAWWGILEYSNARLTELRVARHNPKVDPKQLVRLLWRNPALELLHQRGAGVHSLSSKPKSVLHKHVLEACSLEDIRGAVRVQYKELYQVGGWRG